MHRNSLKQKSGYYVDYKGESVPVEHWCREYGQLFYDDECKRDLRDAGVNVYKKSSFGRKKPLSEISYLRKFV